MLQAIAEFAATLTSPLAVGAVGALAFALRRPPRVRAAGGLVGLLHALPDLLAAPPLLPAALALAAGVGAGLLLAEICLHLVLPAWHLACALAVWLGISLRVAAARLATLAGRRRP